MKILKAKIKKTSPYYDMGLNNKRKPIWLSITGFSAEGVHNYKIKAVKGIKNGFAEYQEIWVGYQDISIKQFDDGQLAFDMFSQQELEENKNNPRYFNQRRFEVTSKNQKQYIHAPDIETARKVAEQYCLGEFKITQVPRRTKKELGE